MYTTEVSRYVHAPRSAVYHALLDADTVALWRVPDGMTCHVHEFDGREGGRFRISLTYDDGSGAGRTTARTDTYHGRFVRLVPDALVVEVLAFETADPALRGEMTMTTTLAHADGGGTDVRIRHDEVPDAVASADNERGTRMALANLARIVETAEGSD